MAEQSIDRAATALATLARNVQDFTAEARELEKLRTRKIRALYLTLWVLVPAVILLIILAFSNFALLQRTKEAAADTRSTNQLLLGCFQPGTKCSDGQKALAMARSTEARQTTYVMLICLRLNPLDSDPNAVGVQRCVQQYYPGFQLPTKVAPTPARTP